MILRRAFACLFVFAAWSRAFAAEAPAVTAAPPTAPSTPPIPTVIESGAAEMVSTEKETTFTFSKGVKVTATNMVLTSEDLVVIARRTGDPTATA